MMKNLQKTLLLLIFAIFLSKTTESSAQNSITPPNSFLNPWHSLKISPDLIGKSKDAMTSSQQELGSTIFKNPMSLQGYIQKNNPKVQLTRNLVRRSQNFVVSKTKTFSQNYSLIEPVLCSLKNQMLVFLTLVDPIRNQLITSSHQAISKELWLKNLKEKTLQQTLSKTLKSLTKDLQSNLRQGNSIQNSALKISFSLGRETTRLDEGSSLCLDMLLEESLANKFKIMRAANTENLATLARIFKLPKASMRSTRKSTNYWFFPKTTQENSFPLTLKLKSSFSEAVFTKPISTSLEREYKITLQNNKIQLTPDQVLLTFLQREQDALLMQDPPKIARIYRAWAYVDKGRAWGLKMNDRLVIKGQEKDIKGHVVGYFGPEMNLKSARGYAINEGAIIFIRKGQNLTKLGQEFTFDLRKFPTPWPPVKNNKQ